MDQDSIFNDSSNDIGTAQRLKPKSTNQVVFVKPSIPSFNIVYDFDIFVFPVGINIHSIDFTTVKQV